jgi:AcrR family transcriptional regulator
VRQAILEAAVGLLSGGGYGDLTVEAIAREAGVSKQTIYRWWPTKAEVVLEALNEAATAIAPGEDSGSLEADLRTLLRRTVGAATAANARMLTGLMAAAQLDDEFATSFAEGFLARRREVLRAALERGRLRGEVAESADLEFLVDFAFGTLWYRLLSRHAPLNRRFADQLADSLLALAQPASGTTGSGGPARAPRRPRSRRAR